MEKNKLEEFVDVELGGFGLGGVVEDKVAFVTERCG
jgi:hypothetical protein